MSDTNGPAPEPRLVRLSQIDAEWEADAKAASEARANKVPRGPVTGLKPLDAELGDHLSPGVHVVHAAPGIGKTGLALQIASECLFPALYVTTEMPLLELMRRLTARITQTFLGRLKSGELTPEESLALFRRTCAAAPLLAFADATQAYASPDWIRNAAQACRGDQQHILIVVDSVHTWADAAPSNLPEYELLNLALSSLRALAGELRCPILVVAERNRQSMKEGGLNAGAGSRKLEYGAESVWDLERDLMAAPDAAGEVTVILSLPKNRNGRAGQKIPLQWSGRLQQFRAVETGTEQVERLFSTEPFDLLNGKSKRRRR